MDWSTMAGLFARHALTSVAGWLVGHNLLAADPSATQAFVGAAMLILGIGWSAYQKYGKALVDAALAKKHGITTALAIVCLLSVAGNAFAADMAVKARASDPFVIGYSGNGWYKGVGTFMEMNDANVAGGNVTAAGGALQACGGYQWANAGGGTFTALQACGAYHNVGGSNLDGAVTSRWSATAEVKFGGPIANILQWLPAGASFPTLPALGSAIGSAHPYMGGGLRLQDAHVVVEDVTKRKIDTKGYLSAGLMQQFCTSPTSCVTADTFFHFAPSQDGVKIFGEQQKLGKQYLGGVNIYF